MQLFADENFPKPIVEALRAEGHDVLWDRTDQRGKVTRKRIIRAAQALYRGRYS
jgi:hypothetical protein